MNIADRIRQLYEEHPEAKQGFSNFGYSTSFDGFLNKLKERPPTDFSLDALDSYESSSDLAIVLAYLPPQVVRDSLGRDAMMWTWIKYHCANRKEELLTAISEIEGIDPKILEKARVSPWRLFARNDAAIVMSMVNLIQHVNNGFLGSLDLAELLRTNAKKEIRISDKRISSYSLAPLNTESTERYYEKGPEERWGRSTDLGDNRRVSVYLDTPVGIGLMYLGVPNAMIAVIAETPERLMIYQLQGVKPFIVDESHKVVRRISSRGLMPLDWQKLLVDSVELLARDLRFQELGIRSGYNNPWIYHDHDGKIHLPLERALVVYDGVAKRLGFKQRREGLAQSLGLKRRVDRNWYKLLN